MTPSDFPKIGSPGRNAGDLAANALSAKDLGVEETAAEARGTVLAAALDGRDEVGVGTEGEERGERRREGGEEGKRGGNKGGLGEKKGGVGGGVEVAGGKTGEFAGARREGGESKEHDDTGGASGGVAVKHARALAWEEYLEEEERRKGEDWDSYGGVWRSTEGGEGLVVWPQSRNEQKNEQGNEQENGGESVAAKESGRDEEVVRVPASISRHLMEHQKEGVRFLYRLFRQNTGGILADDMGLGKTIQAIALMAAVLGKAGTAEDMAAPSVTVTAAAAQAAAVSAAAEAATAATTTAAARDREATTGRGGSSAGTAAVRGAAVDGAAAGGAAARTAILVVVPSSVLGNWQEELNRWGHFRISIFHGSHREAALVQLRSGWAEVVLTTFDTFRVAADTLCPHPWLMAIVDEVHKLRSYSSALFQCADRINTARRYGLSGTVMQNEFRELWSVLQWVRRGYLGSLKEFNERYSDPLRLGQRKGAPQPLVARAQARQVELVRALARVLLRRHKDDLQGPLKLPGKCDMILVCPMTSLQRRVYQRCLKLPDFQLLSRKDELCSCGGPRKRSECHHKGDGGEEMGGGGVLWTSLHPDGLCCPRCPFCVLFPCLSKLQQISNHLELLKPNPRDPPDKQARDLAFARLALAGDADLAGGVRAASDLLTLSSSEHCGKLRALDRLLKQWCGKGDKVLLFSHSVKMLDVLQRFLEARGISFSRLDGSTSTATRQALVHGFNSSPSIKVFLISTKAGGIGLNLVSANRVIIFDPTWNPAHDLQAQDRSFRFGQTRHVSVYRLVAGGTVEEVVYLRQVYKQQQTNIAIEGATENRYFTGVQGSKAHQGELFGVANLFQDRSTSILSAEIIGKATRQPQQQQKQEKQQGGQEMEEETGSMAEKRQVEDVGKEMPRRSEQSAVRGTQLCDSEKDGNDLLVVQVPGCGMAPETPGESPEAPGILSEGEGLGLASKGEEKLVKGGRVKGRKDEEDDNGVSGLARFVEEREVPGVWKQKIKGRGKGRCERRKGRREGRKGEEGLDGRGDRDGEEEEEDEIEDSGGESDGVRGHQGGQEGVGSHADGMGHDGHGMGHDDYAMGSIPDELLDADEAAKAAGQSGRRRRRSKMWSLTEKGWVLKTTLPRPTAKLSQASLGVDSAVVVAAAPAAATAAASQGGIVDGVALEENGNTRAVQPGAEPTEFGSTRFESVEKFEGGETAESSAEDMELPIGSGGGIEERSGMAAQENDIVSDFLLESRMSRGIGNDGGLSQLPPGAAAALRGALRWAPPAPKNDDPKRLKINLDLDIYRARNLFRIGKAQDAEGLMRKAVRDWPDDGRPYVVLGRMLQRKGRLGEARRVFEDGCQALGGDNAFIWQTWAVLEAQAGNVEKARKLFDAATVADERHVAAWHGWAVLELKQGNVRRARELLQKGLKLCGGNEYIYQTLAVMEVQSGRVAEARALFLQATRMNAKSAASWLAWALLEAQQGDGASARLLFQRSLNASPKNPYTWQAWGLFEAAQGRYDRGRLLLQRGAQLNPKDAALLQALALLEYECGFTGTARELFSQASLVDPNHQPVWTALALLEYECGFTGTARELFSQASLVDPNHQPVWTAWGWMEWKEGRVQRARELYQRAVEGNDSSPNAARVFQAWAVLEEREGNIGLARALFKRALAADSGNSVVWRSWAAMEERQGNAVRAEELRLMRLQQRTEVVEPATWDLGGIIGPAIDRMKALFSPTRPMPFSSSRADVSSSSTSSSSFGSSGDSSSREGASSSGAAAGEAEGGSAALLDEYGDEVEEFDVDGFLAARLPKQFSKLLDDVDGVGKSIWRKPITAEDMRQRRFMGEFEREVDRGVREAN
ncbi:unnamed protein product [Closterium sp. Naga37s-1]|nr:unnamed protein product [Closterium sp. Naga37s-1]